MRTYSHALSTFAAARRSNPDSGSLASGAIVGAALPGLLSGIGGAWLWVRRRYSREKFLKEACGRSVFSKPDATLHSAVPVTATLLLYTVFGTERHGQRKSALGFLLGWAGHVVADTLAHGSDARPLLWPISEWRFESPVSYRERARHGRPFTLIEHAALLMVAAWMLRQKYLRAPTG